ncbi:hypothetical protein QWZ13_00050 [Reinekea marina]|uniref:hypothetical protein n=1 Tax=Reinekea marina TaxID=1310421 RepID=UPI0025B481C1|nr:hypothetical protein [Reinekea marina]MDN3647294.1 hypothetical protein [Reinekea marina]
MNNAIQSFDAETKSEPKVLILGSIPGVASLNAHQYTRTQEMLFGPSCVAILV